MDEREETRGRVGGLKEEGSDFTNIFPFMLCSMRFFQKTLDDTAERGHRDCSAKIPPARIR